MESELRGLTNFGYWYRRRNERWVGTLKYIPTDGVRFEVYFEKGGSSPAWGMRQIPMLHWTAFNGVEYTAPEAFVVSSVLFGEAERLEIHSNYLLRGQHLSDPKALVFDSLTFRSDGLIRWTRPRNIKVRRKLDGGHKIVVSYRAPEKIAFDVDNSGQAMLWWSPLAKLNAGEDGEYQINEQAALEMSFPAKQSLTSVINLTQALDLYFSFAANEFCGPPECNLLMKSQEALPRLLLHQAWYKPPTAQDRPDAYFDLNDVKDFLPSSLATWIRTFEAHRSSLLAYFEVRTSPQTIEAQFLYLAQAVEALARELLPMGEPDAKQDREIALVLRKAFKAHFSDDVRKELGSRIYPRLRGLGAPGFNERLQDIAIIYASSLKYVCPPFAALIPEVIKWRNDLTHRNSTEPLNQQSANELFECRDALRVCADLMIFSVMKVPAEVATATLCREFARCFNRRDHSKTLI